jgi:hypothetical protein
MYIPFARNNYNDQVKEGEMGKACSTLGEEKKNAYEVELGNQKKTRCRWETNI